MEQQSLISPGEAMKRLGLTHGIQLRRLVEAGRLTRIVLDRNRRRGTRGFYDEQEVDELAAKWNDEDRRYIIVA